MTKAQQIYERVEALVAAGSTKADAFKQLAEEFGYKLDSVRGAYYTGRQQVGGESATPRARRPRKRETTEADAVAAAVATLQQAIDTIAREVVASEERATEAQAEHEALKAASGPRIEAIQAKIAVLAGSSEDAS